MVRRRSDDGQMMVRLRSKVFIQELDIGGLKLAYR